MTLSIEKHLGQKSEYKTQYDPSLLVREDRAGNRGYLNIDDDAPPFLGHDIWNGYEISALLDNGVPVSMIVRLKYSALNKYIVESKSIKLYFNSFHMTKLGETPAEVRDRLENIAIRDLSDLLETPVEVVAWFNDQYEHTVHKESNSFYNFKSVNNNGVVIPVVLDSLALTIDSIDEYTESPQLLEIVQAVEVRAADIRHKSSALMSRCKVTNQPDTGDIFIAYTPKDGKIVTEKSLLEYIISFRGENHFHEEICEAVYSRLLEKLDPSELFVACLYARRGGFDIVPVRYTSGYRDLVQEMGLYFTDDLQVKVARQ